MNPLHKVLLVGAAHGAGDLLARLLPDKAGPRVLTFADVDAIHRARCKRERRAAKRMGAKP